MHGRFQLGYGAQFIHVAAAMAEDRSEIDDLVAGGADPNARDAGGCAPLHYAADSNPVGDVARALFESGADPEACDDPAGGGDAVENARDQARYACPAFRETHAYRRLMRAASRLRLHDD